MKIVITDHEFGDLRHEAAVAKAHGLMLEVHDCSNDDQTAKAIAGANVVLNNLAPVGAAALSAMARNGVLIRYGVGVDNVDIEAATTAGVTVCNVPDYGYQQVANHAVAMLLSLLRRLPSYDAAVRDGKWGAKALVPDLPAFSEITVGLLGFGSIARATARQLRPFGFRVMASDPAASQEAAAAIDVALVSFDELIETSNALSLHLPLTDTTRHIINSRVLAALPAGATVVNVSRGGLIDELALAQALRSNHIAGAGVDVFETEPLDAKSPLLSAPNTIFSPHAAYYSNKSLDNLQRLAAEEAERFLKGEEPRSPVN